MAWRNIKIFLPNISGLFKPSHSSNWGTLIYTSQSGRRESPGVFVECEKAHDDKGETQQIPHASKSLSDATVLKHFMLK